MSGRRIPVGAALLLLGAGACGGARAPDARPSVLLVSLDTVRADRVGCYGYPRARTPNLDALAARGTRFDRAYAPAPYTLPSHATLLTGLGPDGHGVHANFQGAISLEAKPLAEILGDQGYRTGAFVATSVLDRRFGLARGFGRYDDLSDRPLDASQQVERRGDEVTRSAVAWLEALPPGPFFAFVHYYDAHDPYEPPEGFRDFAEPYDGEIAFVDAQVGELVKALERLGRLANTLVVVVADHGEAFGEHGEEGHGLFVYDTTIRVPIIVAGPAPIPSGRAGTAVADPVGLVDVSATILALLGMPAADGVQGRSLLPLLSGAASASPPLEIESEHSLRVFGWAPLYGLVAGKWKYVQAPEEELYDLSQDPGEEKNRAEANPKERESLAQELARLRGGRTRRPARDVHLGLDARNALSKLGYVEGEEVGDARSIRDLADPKVMAPVAIGATRARALLRAGKFGEVLSTVTTLLEKSPQSGHLWQLQGTAFLRLARPQEAIRSFEKSLEGSPENTERLCGLGDALLAAGRAEEALVRFRAAQAADPEDGQTESRLGFFYARAGKPDEALAHFRRFAELEPNSPNAHTNLANALFANGRIEEGIGHLKRALELDPRCTPAHRAMYAVRKQRRERAEAIASLRAAAAALPQDPFFRSQLAWELGASKATGDAGLVEALSIARACVQDLPQDPGVLDALGVVLARRGEFAEALDVGGRAAARARAAGNAPLADAIERRLASYRNGQPFLE